MSSRRVSRHAAWVVVASTVCLATACGGAPAATSARAPAATARPTHASARPAAQALPQHVLLHVPALSQLPELPNGCEVTSLAMLLTAVGHPVSKLALARVQPVDPTPPTFRAGGSGEFDDVATWGDPEVGFVGSVYGDGIGYGIYHRPLAALLNRLLPGRATDLTGASFAVVLAHVARGTPVLVWDTVTFAPTADWDTWTADGHPVRATQNEHAVLVVGYSPGYVFVNNPLTGQAAEAVPRPAFVAAWQQLGRQAITVSG